LELHRIFNEINKYQHYSHFGKRKTKFTQLGPTLSSFSGSAQPSGPLHRARARTRAAQQRTRARGSLSRAVGHVRAVADR
jgi:hypothetical protein